MTDTQDKIRFFSAHARIAAWLAVGAAVFTFMYESVAGGGGAGLIGVGLLCFVAILFPLLLRHQFEPFEPIVLFIFSVLIGCTFRAIFLAFSDPTNFRIIYLTDGMPLREITANAVWIPPSLAAFSIGYMTIRKRIAIERFSVIKYDRWKGQRLISLSIALAFFSLVAIWQLAQSNEIDFSSWSNLSRKRAIQIETTDGTRYASFGYLAWIAETSKLGLFALYLHWVTRDKRAPMPQTTKFLYALLLASLLVISIAWPILSSSRSRIIQAIFGIVVLSTYFGFRGHAKVRKKKFFRFTLIGVVLATSVLASVGIWRQYSQINEVLDTSVEAAVLNNTVGSGNFLSIERTALIIERMSARNDWRLGESYLNILFAPIPRILWHEKPEMSLGLFVKRELYGHPTGTNGNPPGLLGESFINFGFVGLLILPMLAGMILRLFFNSFNPLLGKNKNATILYTLALWPIGFELAEVDFCLTVMDLATALIPGYFFLRFVSIRDEIGMPAQNLRPA